MVRQWRHATGARCSRSRPGRSDPGEAPRATARARARRGMRPGRGRAGRTGPHSSRPPASAPSALHLFLATGLREPEPRRPRRAARAVVAVAWPRPSPPSTTAGSIDAKSRGRHPVACPPSRPARRPLALGTRLAIGEPPDDPSSPRRTSSAEEAGPALRDRCRAPASGAGAPGEGFSYIGPDGKRGHRYGPRGLDPARSPSRRPGPMSGSAPRVAATCRRPAATRADGSIPLPPAIGAPCATRRSTGGMIEFGQALPAIRRRVDPTFASHGLPARRCWRPWCC